jgi:uroporphyrinogen-III synthase
VRLLVTRPEPDAERTAAQLRACGHKVSIAPLLQIEALAADLGEATWGAVAMTSANAARTIERHPRLPELVGLPAFVVGRRTAAVARAAGFGDVTSADGNEGDLARLIGARLHGSPGPLLYLAGEDRADDLAGDLQAHGLQVRVVAVYRATKAARFPPTVEEALAAGRLDGVLHYSRRSAQAYIECAGAADILSRALLPFHCCLSPQVAEPLLAAGAAEVRIATRPEEAALLELICP